MAVDSLYAVFNKAIDHGSRLVIFDKPSKVKDSLERLIVPVRVVSNSV